LLAHRNEGDHVLAPGVGLEGQVTGGGEVGHEIDDTVALAGSQPLLGKLK
jgi:hypothetical protein